MRMTRLADETVDRALNLYWEGLGRDWSPHSSMRSALNSVPVPTGWCSDDPPRDRKILVLWRDMYSLDDLDGVKLLANHSYWLHDQWMGKPSSHWEFYRWAEFPDLPEGDHREPTNFK